MISEKHKSLEAEARLNDCAVRKTSTHIGWFKTPTVEMVFECTSIFTIEIHKLSSTVSGIHHGCLYVVVVRVTPPHGVDVPPPHGDSDVEVRDGIGAARRVKFCQKLRSRQNLRTITLTRRLRGPRGGRMATGTGIGSTGGREPSFVETIPGLLRGQT